MNKKAQGLSVQTIILIILGIVVLVVLIVGFTMGWGNIKDWIIPSNNVNAIVDQCNIACGTGQKYDYCFAPKELKSEDEKLEGVTCYSLAEKRSIYGIGACPAVDCGILDAKTLAEDSCDDKDEGTELWYLDGVSVNKIVCGEEASE